MTGDPLTGVSEDSVAQGCKRLKEEKAFGREVSGTKRDVSVPKYLLRIAERAKTAKEYVEILFASRGMSREAWSRPSARPEGGCMEAEVFCEVRNLAAVLDDMLFFDKIDVFRSRAVERIVRRLCGVEVALCPATSVDTFHLADWAAAEAYDLPKDEDLSPCRTRIRREVTKKLAREARLKRLSKKWSGLGKFGPRFFNDELADMELVLSREFDREESSDDEPIRFVWEGQSLSYQPRDAAMPADISAELSVEDRRAARNFRRVARRKRLAGTAAPYAYLPPAVERIACRLRGEEVALGTYGVPHRSRWAAICAPGQYALCGDSKAGWGQGLPRKAAKIAAAARTQAAAAARERWARAATEVFDGGGGGRRREKLRVKRTWQGRDLRSPAQRRSDAEDGLLNLLKPMEPAAELGKLQTGTAAPSEGMIPLVPYHRLLNSAPSERTDFSSDCSSGSMDSELRYSNGYRRVLM